MFKKEFFLDMDASSLASIMNYARELSAKIKPVQSSSDLSAAVLSAGIRGKEGRSELARMILAKRGILSPSKKHVRNAMLAITGTETALSRYKVGVQSPSIARDLWLLLQIKKLNLAALDNRHFGIFALRSLGHSVKEIAAHVGVSGSSINLLYKQACTALEERQKT